MSGANESTIRNAAFYLSNTFNFPLVFIFLSVLLPKTTIFHFWLWCKSVYIGLFNVIAINWLTLVIYILDIVGDGVIVVVFNSYSIISCLQHLGVTAFTFYVYLSRAKFRTIQFMFYFWRIETATDKKSVIFFLCFFPFICVFLVFLFFFLVPS